MATPVLDLVLKVNGTERASVPVPVRFARFLLYSDRLGLAKDATIAAKAFAVLTAITTRARVMEKPDSPGSEFGDWVRKKIGEARTLGRDLTTEEWQAEGSNAILAELDVTPDA